MVTIRVGSGSVPVQFLCFLCRGFSVLFSFCTTVNTILLHTSYTRIKHYNRIPFIEYFQLSGHFSNSFGVDEKRMVKTLYRRLAIWTRMAKSPKITQSVQLKYRLTMVIEAFATILFNCIRLI